MKKPRESDQNEMARTKPQADKEGAKASPAYSVEIFNAPDDDLIPWMVMLHPIAIKYLMGYDDLVQDDDDDDEDGDYNASVSDTLPRARTSKRRYLNVDFEFGDGLDHIAPGTDGRLKWFATPKAVGDKEALPHVWETTRAQFLKIKKALEFALRAGSKVYKRQRLHSQEIERHRVTGFHRYNDGEKDNECEPDWDDRYFRMELYTKGENLCAWKMRMPRPFYDWLRSIRVELVGQTYFYYFREAGEKHPGHADATCLELEEHTVLEQYVSNLDVFRHTEQERDDWINLIERKFQDWKAEGYPIVDEPNLLKSIN